MLCPWDWGTAAASAATTVGEKTAKFALRFWEARCCWTFWTLDGTPRFARDWVGMSSEDVGRSLICLSHTPLPQWVHGLWRCFYQTFDRHASVKSGQFNKVICQSYKHRKTLISLMTLAPGALLWPFAIAPRHSLPRLSDNIKCRLDPPTVLQKSISQILNDILGIFPGVLYSLTPLKPSHYILNFTINSIPKQVYPWLDR